MKAESSPREMKDIQRPPYVPLVCSYILEIASFLKDNFPEKKTNNKFKNHNLITSLAGKLTR